jgi:hypothetical protein
MSLMPESKGRRRRRQFDEDFKRKLSGWARGRQIGAASGQAVGMAADATGTGARFGGLVHRCEFTEFTLNSGFDVREQTVQHGGCEVASDSEQGERSDATCREATVPSPIESR